MVISKIVISNTYNTYCFNGEQYIGILRYFTSLRQTYITIADRRTVERRGGGD